MSARSLRIIVAVCTLCCAATSASAFDGNRKGFILGFGLGPTYSHIQLPPQNLQSAASGIGVATDFRIGYGPTEQLLLYYDNRVSWVSGLVFINEDLKHTHVEGCSGIGATYYFSRKSPSVFVSGGVGVSAVRRPFNSSSYGYGYGMSAGGGYEFGKLFNIEGTLTYGNAGRGRPDDTVDAMGARVMFNILGY